MSFDQAKFGASNEEKKVSKVEEAIINTYAKNNSQLQEVHDMQVKNTDYKKSMIFETTRGAMIDLKTDFSKNVLQNVLIQLEGKNMLEKLAVADTLQQHKNGVTFALQHLLKETGANLVIDGEYGPITKQAIEQLPIQGKKFYANGIPTEAVLQYLVNGNKNTLSSTKKSSTEDAREDMQLPTLSENKDYIFNRLLIGDLGAFVDNKFQFEGYKNVTDIEIEGEKFINTDGKTHFSGRGFKDTGTGVLYVGEFVNGKYEGTGVMFTSTGKRIEGTWKHGVIVTPEVASSDGTKKKKQGETTRKKDAGTTETQPENIATQQATLLNLLKQQQLSTENIADIQTYIKKYGTPEQISQAEWILVYVEKETAGKISANNKAILEGIIKSIESKKGMTEHTNKNKIVTNQVEKTPVVGEKIKAQTTSSIKTEKVPIKLENKNTPTNEQHTIIDQQYKNTAGENEQTKIEDTVLPEKQKDLLAAAKAKPTNATVYIGDKFEATKVTVKPISENQNAEMEIIEEEGTY